MLAEVASQSRKSMLVRDAILDAVIARLEAADPRDVSMPEIANDSGVSLRTLYRYFATRDDLLAAAGERIQERLHLPVVVGDADDLVGSFRKASGRLARQPQLARALVSTPVGRGARSPQRQQRIASIESALAGVTEQMSPAQARRTTAVIAHLCSSVSWLTICEESGLSSTEAREAVAWALERLIEAARTEGT